MALIRQTSPHTLGQNKTSHIMRLVLIALVPALAAQTWFFGWGIIINVIWCSVIALGAEAWILALRKRPLSFYLRDNSALVTAWLLAMALPAAAPWWLSLIGVGFAIIFGKQLYGGMGNNPFNPAMVGYVLLLISFPQEMTSWVAPLGSGISAPGIGDSFSMIFAGSAVDGWTMATPLDILRENKSLTMNELWQNSPQLSGMTGLGWFWTNLAFLAGGLYLLKEKAISWHAPAGMLLALAVLSLLFWNGTGSESHGSPIFHLFSGATMMGAFFIVTDPVSGATSNKGRLLFGLGVGTLTYVIRAWGGYPDGVAFATLLMNMAAPAIDYWTQPRTYGHRKPKRGMAKTK
ncbi:electron transport complex subunit RsxD [Sansalvadorimonas sp. 2012CJ34-2]|uniref:Ion-translocating oxidoreductase complex subunit D n=1 Tax=Parendozoicomonas callyspongiae TaxID=2942213 RepID=A0ABT0PIA0_9GAMM|nr:electron transport complex subunit RsxD [Sansalvadorimonas sp. 2012CJ34-2]MCL6270976.1 electron transport complex subunit RsxD [Sansalvadorimonas sp. 2012CJ34-2]